MCQGARRIPKRPSHTSCVSSYTEAASRGALSAAELDTRCPDCPRPHRAFLAVWPGRRHSPPARPPTIALSQAAPPRRRPASALQCDAPGGGRSHAADGGGHQERRRLRPGIRRGRLVITAAKRYGARGVGIDIDAPLIAQSRASARKEGVDALVEFRQQDALTVDVSPASVVTLYLLSGANLKLRPTLQKQLRPGSRIVSHDFGMGDGSPPAPRRSPIKRDPPALPLDHRHAMTDFVLHTKLHGDSIEIATLPLCLVRLMNDRRFPWSSSCRREAESR